MIVFGYGSLMNAASLAHSAPNARLLRPAVLKGYRRVFDFPNHHRTNPETGLPTSALVIRPDPHTQVTGMLIEVPEVECEALREREDGYVRTIVQTEDGTPALTFVTEAPVTCAYAFGDPTQADYLQICLDAAREHGFEDNFLKSTFIGEQTLADIGLEKLTSRGS